MKITIDKNTGNLIITIDRKESRELKTKIKEGYIPIEDALECIFCNGYTSVSPSTIGALTDSPIITDGGYSDDGEIIEPNKANFWWYPQYELLDPIKELANNLKLEFTRMQN